MQLYQAACDGGSQAGCAMLGAQYEAGHQVPNTFITKDLVRAATLYERGCPAESVPSESDDPIIATIVASSRAHACGNLGSFYEHGTAVAQDLARALTFYQRACDAQNTKSAEIPKLQNRCDDLSRLKQQK